MNYFFFTVEIGKDVCSQIKMNFFTQNLREVSANLLIKNNTLEFEIKEIEDKIDNEILKLYSIDREELEL